ncbi:sialate O-acetylesterase [Planctomycetes bacterium K23_9]|uniref:Arylsulfatase n=1 Tax=Stieleria marina TaxID=1930275 RepID=A0A517NZX0_9BACT|nr:Arylsulfatase [Planctomycetes bacterium K23_9]
MRLLSLVLLFALGGVTAADEFDVYLLAGQSNMDGRGRVSDLSSEQMNPVADAIIFYRSVPHSSDGWKSLTPGFSIPPKHKGGLPSPTFGPEVGFSKAMLEAKPGTKLALIKGSKGGTSLRADWKPGVAGDPDTQGPRYRDFVETIRLATAELQQRGDQYKLRGLLWHQGESDSKAKSSVYQKRLEEFIARIRQDVGVDDLPVVVGEVFDNGKRDGVRAAIRKVSESVQGVGFVPASGLTTSDEGTHFDAKSQLKLGQRFADAIRDVQSKGVASSKQRIVCFGDSITKRGFPAILAESLDVDAINAGVGGHTSSEGLRRIQKDVLNQKPAVTVIFFGTNDIRVDNDRKHVPLEKYRDNLNAMITSCRKIGSEVVVCTLPPINAEPFFTRHERSDFGDVAGLEQAQASYRAAAIDVATASSVPVVDLQMLLKQEPQWMSGDGVHPSEAGNQIIAKHIAEAVAPLLRPKPKPPSLLDRKLGQTPKPNVLFISVDDLNDWVGCLGGNPDAQTPNLDAFAKRSVLFDNAHCQVALCNASRSSVLTGLYASTSGIYGNTTKHATDAYKDATQMPVWFGENGYRTMCMGKIYHNDHGRKSYWDEIGPKTLRWGPEPPGGRQFTKRFGTDAKDTLAWAALDIEEGGMPDEQIAAWGIQQLDQPRDEPFFLALGFYKPHTPMTAPKRYFDQFDRDSLTMPRVLEDDLSDVPELGRRWVLDRQKLIAEKAVQQYSPTYRRELVHAYHACVSLIDDCIGQVLQRLAQSPHADNTIVVLWSDHGWHLGEKNHWRKWMPWEESTRSLMMVHVPEALANGSVCSRTVGLIDIYPTLAKLCNLESPEGLEGRSFHSLLSNSQSAWERPALTSTTEGNHTVRSERWRYIRYVDGTEELYDHHKDPDEWHNLAHEPSLVPVKKEHASWIDQLTAGERTR